MPEPRGRVLIVEDEILIAMDLEHQMLDAGHEVVGPFENVRDALRAIDQGPPDAAVLDVQLDGEDVFPVAERLVAEQIPLIFHSGHAVPDKLRERFPTARFCSKPCPPGLLEREVEEALAPRAEA